MGEEEGWGDRINREKLSPILSCTPGWAADGPVSRDEVTTWVEVALGQ